VRVIGSPQLYVMLYSLLVRIGTKSYGFRAFLVVVSDWFFGYITFSRCCFVLLSGWMTSSCNVAVIGTNCRSSHLVNIILPWYVHCYFVGLFCNWYSCVF